MITRHYSITIVISLKINGLLILQRKNMDNHISTTIITILPMPTKIIIQALTITILTTMITHKIIIQIMAAIQGGQEPIS